MFSLIVVLHQPSFSWSRPPTVLFSQHFCYYCKSLPRRCSPYSWRRARAKGRSWSFGRGPQRLRRPPEPPPRLARPNRVGASAPTIASLPIPGSGSRGKKKKKTGKFHRAKIGKLENFRGKSARNLVFDLNWWIHYSSSFRGGTNVNVKILTLCRPKATRPAGGDREQRTTQDTRCVVDTGHIPGRSLKSNSRRSA